MFLLELRVGKVVTHESLADLEYATRLEYDIERESKPICEEQTNQIIIHEHAKQHPRRWRVVSYTSTRLRRYNAAGHQSMGCRAAEVTLKVEAD